MKHTRDSRKPDEAATEKDAVNGGNQTQSAAPKSWKEYIDQAIPIQKEEAGAEQSAAPKEEAKPRWDADQAKARAREAWEGFARWAGEAGKNARAAGIYRP